MTLQNDLQIAQAALQSGRHKATLKAAKSGMSKNKTHPVFPNIYGIALCGLGRQREAVGYFQKALRLSGEYHDARKNLAQTLIVLNKFEPALKILQRLVTETKKDDGAWYLLAQAHMKTGDMDAAEQAINKAIDLQPTQARNYNMRALLRNDRGQIKTAIQDFETALRLNPKDVETLTNISLPLARQTRHDEALNVVTQAVALAPDHVGARLRLAMQLVETGQTDRAIAEFQQVLARVPNDPEAIEQLAALQSRDQNEALLPSARAALKKSPKNSPSRASLNFALARMAEQSGDPDQAARYLADANREMAAILPYDAQADKTLNAALLAPFNTPLPPESKDAVTAPRPIFVVGLPRSGTTLTEAILGAHPKVKALGERVEAGMLVYPIVENNGDFDPVEFASEHTALLPDLPDDAVAYTDKMPENYRLLGFLKLAYPHCRIINLRRDPRDVALSMWRGHFQGRALAYTYDLQAMAHRFNLYAQTMAHWHQVLPGQILDLRYEDLVSDVQTTSQTLATWCGLDWVAAMARPDQSDEQILTLSASQLRQPVHMRSVGKWRQHEKLLAPFVKNLDPALWPNLG